MGKRRLWFHVCVMADTVADHIARLRLLVHRLDDLEHQRASIDAEIAKVTRELNSYGTISTGVASEVDPDAAAEAEAEAPSGMSLLGGTKADIAFAMVIANPKVGYAELARSLYGDESEASKNKARSVMYFLTKKAKKVRREDDGSWTRLDGDIFAEANPA